MDLCEAYARQWAKLENALVDILTDWVKQLNRSQSVSITRLNYKSKDRFIHARGLW